MIPGNEKLILVVMQLVCSSNVEQHFKMQNSAAESSKCRTPAQLCHCRTKNRVISAFNKDEFKLVPKCLFLEKIDGHQEIWMHK